MSSFSNIDGPDRYRLRDELRLVRSPICQPGKIMWWCGLRHLGTDDLNRPLLIPRGCDAASIAAADYDRIFLLAPGVVKTSPARVMGQQGGNHG